MQQDQFSTGQNIEGVSHYAAPPLTITAGQVAHLVGVSEEGFRKKRLELEAFGFPPKLPGLNKWSRAAVTRWVETNGQSFAPATIEEGLRAEADALEAQYSRAS